ncbi:hypothetical protein RVR_8353 [Actinacidiphila reveromycinica]|uniref:Uncharacterized protein n=1 Tax=Actinacidiphila reveromycinica TaxID=659352 RepID=A0A7U3VRQ6_9ACTN|nr:hypothetical protein RVR_8353 [Streptomyces sp. SN-593]
MGASSEPPPVPLPPMPRRLARPAPMRRPAVSESTHRPSDPPHPNVVLNEPATVEACKADYSQRGGPRDGAVAPQPHTLGRK